MASRIREVWAENLEDEMANIRIAVEKYPFVAMVRHSPISLLDRWVTLDWLGCSV
jgi:hypothetical protein